MNDKFVEVNSNQLGRIVIQVIHWYSDGTFTGIIKECRENPKAIGEPFTSSTSTKYIAVP